MFRIDKGCNTTFFLCLRNSVKGNRCLTGAYKLLTTCHAVFPGMLRLLFFGFNSEQKRW